MKHNEIMGSSDHFANTTCDLSVETMANEALHKEQSDPFEDVNSEFQTKCYRMNSVVFAEPLKTTANVSACFKDTGDNHDDLTVIDNVMVQRRRGHKYKKYHINMVDSTNLCCPQPNCNHKFTTTKLLKAHIRKVHCADRRYICDICGNMFSCHYLLVRHSVVHSGRSVQCRVCGVTLSETTSLAAHLRTHSGIKPHTCAVCNKSFSRKSSLDTHVKFVHKQGMLQCLKCDERFDTRSQWTRHMSTQHRANKSDGAPN